MAGGSGQRGVRLGGLQHRCLGLASLCLLGRTAAGADEAGQLPCSCDLCGHQVWGFWDLLLFLSPCGGEMRRGLHPTSFLLQLLGRFGISYVSRGWMKL